MCCAACLLIDAARKNRPWAWTIFCPCPAKLNSRKLTEVQGSSPCPPTGKLPSGNFKSPEMGVFGWMGPLLSIQYASIVLVEQEMHFGGWLENELCGLTPDSELF